MKNILLAPKSVSIVLEYRVYARSTVNTEVLFEEMQASVALITRGNVSSEILPRLFREVTCPDELRKFESEGVLIVKDNGMSLVPIYRQRIVISNLGSANKDTLAARVDLDSITTAHKDTFASVQIVTTYYTDLEAV